jgi:hypothetical protein
MKDEAEESVLPPSSFIPGPRLAFASIATRLALFAADFAAAPWLAHEALLSVSSQ